MRKRVLVAVLFALSATTFVVPRATAKMSAERKQSLLREASPEVMACKKAAGAAHAARSKKIRDERDAAIDAVKRGGGDRAQQMAAMKSILGRTKQQFQEAMATYKSERSACSVPPPATAK